MVAVASEPAKWRFNPFSQSYYQDPYAALRRLREEDPVHWAFFNMWAVTRYKDVIEILRDRETYSADHIVDWDGYTAYRKPAGADSPFVKVEKGFLVFNEAATHTRFRNAMKAAFKPEFLNGLRPEIQRFLDSLLAKYPAGSRVDLMEDIVVPLCTHTLCEMLGIPPGHEDEVHKAVVAFNLGIEPLAGAAVIAAADRSAEDMKALFLTCRELHTDKFNLLSVLLEAEAKNAVSFDESFALWTTIVLAGSSTAINTIVSGMLLLLRHPDQAQRLRDEPALLRSGINEILRYETPGTIVTRAMTADAILGGKTLKKGQLVMAFLGAANRDPELFTDPDKFLVDRKNSQQQIAFGQGVHFCLGEHLARIEIDVTLRTLLDRYPRMQLASESIVWHSRVHWRGIKSLPVQL